MINQQLISPQHIAVIGASEHESKPGGKVLFNLLNGGFKGKIYGVNPKQLNIDGVIHVKNINDLPTIDLAILAIPAEYCIQAVKDLIQKKTKAFIIYSSGFGEAGEKGKLLENELVEIITRANACLIGPNCIGVINENYKGVFTTPIPVFDSKGCELISSSGATAVFIMEAAKSTGLRFSNVYSIGNASQISAEDILEHMDKTFDSNSPKVKLLYLESIRNPFKLLKHASSLIKKGCKIAAIKSGHSDAGGRAASSHTGALATSDIVIRALFKKAGIMYCSGRDELISVGCIFQSNALKGNRIAIITHAGGSAVMLTDALCSRGMEVPLINAEKSAALLAKLNPGSSVSNPIDFLATGTAKQLGEIIDFCETLAEIDGIIVVFGSPGLFNVRDVYQLLDEKMQTGLKPIFPVLPSLVNAKEEIELFISKGRINFSDEVILGRALPHVYKCAAPTFGMTHLMEMETASIRSIISQAPNGYLTAEQCNELLNACGINMVKEHLCYNHDEITTLSKFIRFPVVIKVLGPLHKTEVNGVTLNVNSEDLLHSEFDRMMKIHEAKGVVIQPMVSGEELYCGAAKQGNYGHLILAGLGGIYVEVLKDISYGLAPLNILETTNMIHSLKGYEIIKGYRKREGVNEELFADAIMRIASLVCLAPEISELDINPFRGNMKELVAVDVRIKIDKSF